MTEPAAAAALPERALTILIAALGGEGGGLLTDWIVGAATRAGLPVQSTSIPGVAQRTGATTYYLEIFPAPLSALGGLEPVMSLYPSPGDVDVMVASELIEAGRAVEGGFVTPERTALVASTHRIYAIGEKSAMADGTHDASRVLDAAHKMARRALLFDLDGVARAHDSALNAVLLGVIAGAGLTPIPPAAFEEAVRARAVAVDANLRGFAAGQALAGEEFAAPAPPPRDGTTPADFPLPLHKVLDAGVSRLEDYQDADYAETYLARLAPVLAAENEGQGADDGVPLTSETARHLALWMSYEDVIRVAALKTRAARHARVREEVGAGAHEPVHVTEFLKPGVEEISAILPRGLGRALLAWADRRGIRHRLNLSLRVRTDTVFGFFLLWLLARLRPWRRRTFRFAEEQALIERWLAAVARAAAQDHAFALEVARAATLNKGYGDTHARGRASFLAVMDRVVMPALDGVGTIDPAAALAAAIDAALADPEGGALGSALAELAPA